MVAHGALAEEQSLSDIGPGVVDWSIRAFMSVSSGRLPRVALDDEESADAVSCLLLTGTVGSGKTATAYAIGDQLRQVGTRHAVIDLDELRRSWPAPPDDPFNGALELANLGAVSQNYRHAGARRIVLAGVVEGAGAADRYSAAVGMPVIICRLRVPLDRVQRRLIARHEPGPLLEWHLQRSGQLDGILEREDAAQVTVDVQDDSVGDVAQRVLSAVGWN